MGAAKLLAELELLAEQARTRVHRDRVPDPEQGMKEGRGKSN